MTNLTQKLTLTSLLGSVLMLAVACGGGKESSTPMRPNAAGGTSGIEGAQVMKNFRAYKADPKLASGVAGGTAVIGASSAGANVFDASVKILMHSTSGELVGLSATGAALESNKPRLLEMDASCGNSKFDIEAMCAGVDCTVLAVRIVEKPAANSPKISELEVGKATPDTTGYAQTALVFKRETPVVKANAAQVARVRAAVKRAGVTGAEAAATVDAATTPVASATPIKMVRRWSERWAKTADENSAAGVKTTFEEAVALAKREGTSVGAVEACLDPAAAATTPVPATAAAPTTEPAAAGTQTADGVSEINAGPLN